LKRLADATLPGVDGDAPRDSLPRVKTVVESLRKDGLVVVVRNTEAVAEEPAAYGENVVETVMDLQVRLP
jgi:hypothetical protein